MTVGHGGPTGRYDSLRETAFEYAFFLDAVGLAAIVGRTMYDSSGE